MNTPLQYVSQNLNKLSLSHDQDVHYAHICKNPLKSVLQIQKAGHWEVLCSIEDG